MTAKREGQQVDTLPSQMYGITSAGDVKKLSVDSDGKIIVSGLDTTYLRLDMTNDGDITGNLDLGIYDFAATNGDFSGDLTAGGDIICNNIYAANLSGNTDGGFANSVYLAIQLIDGGGA